MRLALRSVLVAIAATIMVSATAPSTPAFAQTSFDPNVEAPQAPPASAEDLEIDAEQAGDADGDFFDQDPNAVARSLYQNCWGCTVFDLFMVKGVDASNRVANAMQGEMLAVLGIITLCYVIFKIGGGLAVGDASDLTGRFFASYKMLMVSAVAAALLTGGTGGGGGSAVNNVWDYVAGPVMSVPLSAADTIAAQNGFGGASCGGSPVNSGNAVGDSAISAMRGMICKMHQATSGGIANAWAFVKTGTGLIDRLIRFLIGVFMMGCFAWVALTFPARFIEAFIRLLAVIMLSPVLVVCAAFKHTRNFAVIGVKNLLYVGMLTMFMSFIFVVAVNVMGAVSSFDPRMMSGDAIASYAVAPVGVVVDASNVVMSLPYYLFAIGVTFILNKIIAEGPKLAERFSEVQIGSSVSDGAIGAIGSIASAPAKGAGMAVGASVAQKAATEVVAAGVTRGASRGLGVG